MSLHLMGLPVEVRPDCPPDQIFLILDDLQARSMTAAEREKLWEWYQRVVRLNMAATDGVAGPSAVL